MFVFESKKDLPSFWLLQIIGWMFYWLMICVTFLPVMAPEKSVVGLFEHKFVRALIGFALTCAMRLIYKRLAKNASLLTAALASLGLSVVFGVAWAYLMIYYSSLTNAVFDFASVHARAARDILDFSTTLLAWSAFYFGIKFWDGRRAERENALEAANLANRAQLEMLRYQLNPHFLFNSLNSIRASIDEDAGRAKQMVTQLAEFLRYSLLNCDEREVTLAEEIEAVRNYLAIEKTRFEDKLEIEFEIDESAANLPVPCFLLNPLVENAVKHGLNGSDKPLKIRVSARSANGALILEIANTGALKSAGNGTKVGLKNVRERLEKMFDARGTFALREENGWVRAQIKIAQT